MVKMLLVRVLQEGCKNLHESLEKTVSYDMVFKQHCKIIVIKVRLFVVDIYYQT